MRFKYDGQVSYFQDYTSFISMKSYCRAKRTIEMEEVKMEELYCQSCGMPLTAAEGPFGKEADGSENRDYCSYCYTDGKFTSDIDMDGMIEICVPYFVEAQPGMTQQGAREQMKAYFPMMKRWSKA